MSRLNIGAWRDRADFLLPVRNGILEIPSHYKYLLGTEGGYVLVKDREAAFVYHPFLAFYKIEDWLRMWMSLEIKSEKSGKDFLERSDTLESRVNEEGSILMEIPQNYLQYAGINKDSNVKVMRGAGSLFELWNPGELEEYERVELDNILQKK